MKRNPHVERTRAFLRIEETVTELIYCAEQFETAKQTTYGIRNARRNLLEAGRRYGAALQSLARRR